MKVTKTLKLSPEKHARYLRFKKLEALEAWQKASEAQQKDGGDSGGVAENDGGETGFGNEVGGDNCTANGNSGDDGIANDDAGNSVLATKNDGNANDEDSDVVVNSSTGSFATTQGGLGKGKKVPKAKRGNKKRKDPQNKQTLPDIAFEIAGGQFLTLLGT